MAYPDPLQTFRALFCESAVVESDSGGVQDADFLEPNRRVARIYCNQREVFICESLDGFRELPLMEPEAWRCEMVRSGLQRPSA